MIRQAVWPDLDSIEAGYREHFLYEKEHGAFTVFREGVYPTRKDAEKALKKNSLYIYEENGNTAGSMILDGEQPEEYKEINWPCRTPAEKVMVIHLIMVHPGMGKKGIGSSLVNYALEIAGLHSCKAVRLDTGAQNIPAVSLYKKLGFEIAGTSAMKVGGRISHNEHLFFEKAL